MASTHSQIFIWRYVPFSLLTFTNFDLKTRATFSATFLQTLSWRHKLYSVSTFSLIRRHKLHSVPTLLQTLISRHKLYSVSIFLQTLIWWGAIFRDMLTKTKFRLDIHSLTNFHLKIRTIFHAHFYKFWFEDTGYIQMPLFYKLWFEGTSYIPCPLFLWLEGTNYIPCQLFSNFKLKEQAIFRIHFFTNFDLETLAIFCIHFFSNFDFKTHAIFRIHFFTNFDLIEGYIPWHVNKN